MSLFDWVVSVAPHHVRRRLYRTAHSWEFEYFESFRKVENEDGYCLRSFDEHGVVFVHVPKAAGISVCRSLFGNLAGGHTTIAQYQVIFHPAEFDRYFKFTFVRDPWDRIHSAYHFLMRGGFGELDACWARENLGGFANFDDFVKRWVNEKNIESWVHFRPQHRFVCLPGRPTPAVDFVGRFENLEEDYEFVRARIPGAGPLRHENRTERPDFRDDYSEESRAIVARVYRRDIDMFGY
ncbi:MAG: sulfotransferase family 2 domain-containing protein [Planctomycetota bacterium]